MPVKTDTETSQIPPASAVPKDDVEWLSASAILERRDVKELRELVELRRKVRALNSQPCSISPLVLMYAGMGQRCLGRNLQAHA